MILMIFKILFKKTLITLAYNKNINKNINKNRKVPL